MKNENELKFSFFIYQILREMNWHTGTRIITLLQLAVYGKEGLDFKHHNMFSHMPEESTIYKVSQKV